jgi:hypothetical protein
MSALMIENHMSAADFENAVPLYFHTRPEFIGTLMEGIASFTPDGRFLAANRDGLPPAALYDHYRAAAPGLLDLCMHNSVRVRGRAELRLRHGVHMLTAASAPRSATTAQALQQQSAIPAPARALRALDTGDARVAQVLDKVERVPGRAVPIMILAARAWPLRRREPRVDPGIADRIRTVRLRRRRIHGRAQERRARPHRAGQRRHAVPRRNRRHAAHPAGAPAARAR